MSFVSLAFLHFEQYRIDDTITHHWVVTTSVLTCRQVFNVEAGRQEVFFFFQNSKYILSFHHMINVL